MKKTLIYDSRLADGCLFGYASTDCFLYVMPVVGVRRKYVVSYLCQFLNDANEYYGSLTQEWVQSQLYDSLQMGGMEHVSLEENQVSWLVFCRGKVFSSGMNLVRTKKRYEVFCDHKLVHSMHPGREVPWLFIGIFSTILLLVEILLIVFV